MLTPPATRLLLTRYGRISVARLRTSTTSLLREQRPQWQPAAWRMLSSQAKNEEKTKDPKNEEDPGSEIVLTPGEKVVAASRLTMWAGIAVFAACCAYFIGVELFPT